MTSLHLAEEFELAWHDRNAFDCAREVSGRIFREAPGRQTLQFELNGRSYFIKRHTGVGWAEIIKNGSTLKMPILGAATEFQAIKFLNSIAVPTMTVAAFGERGRNPARRESFLVTEDLSPTVSLEDFCAQWRHNPPDIKFKRQLISQIALIARQMHTSGICHRDFYLCHFLLRSLSGGQVDTTQPPQLWVIDLHRALIRKRLPTRWVIKDLAGLLFSSLDIGLTRTDLCRFVKVYSAQTLSEAFKSNNSIWPAVVKKARRIERRDWKKLNRRRVRSLYQDNSHIARLQSFDKVALINRQYLTPQLQQFCQSPDDLMEKGRLLKGGDSTTVTAVNLDGKELVVKRYNMRSGWYRLRRLFRPSRAWYCWASAHQLQWMGVDTPTPVLMLERRWWLLRREAYFVTEQVAGQDVLGMIQSGDSRVNWNDVLACMRRLFSTMQRYRLVHGDLKASNLLYSPGQLTVIDLDATRYEMRRRRFHKYFMRDVARFLANWRHDMAMQDHIKKQLGTSIRLDKAD